MLVAAAAGCGASTARSSPTLTVLTVAAPSAPSSLDPATGEPSNETYLDFAYDPLIVQAADGSFKPGLATSWKYGQNNETFTMNLRSGVKFSDGTALTAAAVKDWINYTMQAGKGGNTYLSTLKTIDATGPLALTMTFSKPTPNLEIVFGQILGIGMVGSPHAVTAKTLATKTAGAGPYVLDTATSVPGASYTYTPNPYYWNKEAVHWKKVVVKVISNQTTVLQALQTGQVQVAKDQPVSSINAAQKRGLKYVDPLTLLLGLNLMDRNGKVDKPLSSLQVRQALNYAVDRTVLANVIAKTYGVPTNQMSAPGWNSYNSAIAHEYPYNPAKARQMLASAGYPNGFILHVVSVNAVGQDLLGKALVGQLAKIGVTLKLDIATSFGQYFQALGSNKYSSSTFSFGHLPAAFNYDIIWGPTAVYNPYKVTSTSLADLNSRVRAASAAEQPAIEKQIQASLVDQAWFVPVVAIPLVVLHSTQVTDVNATPHRNVVYMTEIKPAQ